LRASTLFAITVAVLLGLGAAVTAKAIGLFNRPQPPPPSKPEEIQVLVPTHNLFDGFTIQAADVKTRPLRPDEVSQYRQHKDDYLPPAPAAAVFRVLKKNVEAEQPLLREHVQDLAMAQPINQRLLPNMRALNVSLKKEFCAGGLIQVGDWVDVHLTSQIGMGDNDNATTRTASLAHYVRVIAKRNILWPMLAALPDDQPVNFTIEANPYRSALIEFATSKGQLALIPVPATEQRQLEERRQALLRTGNRDLPSAFSEPDSNEYRDEDTRVASFLRGELTVGDTDLVRIFGIQTPPPQLLPTVVQMYSGIDHDSNVIFSHDSGPQVEALNPLRPGNRSAARVSSVSTAATGLSFRVPGEDSPRKCKTCGKKK
jgi:Flp pilus assembly protein CpaB